jgi:signal transduction histidine kinase
MDRLEEKVKPVQDSQEEIEDLREQIAALRSELQETRKSTNQYLQNVAHQLTAPLNAIKWGIEAIKDDRVSIPRKSKLLSSIYSQGTILVHLIKNFSLMSNLEADHELGQFREQPERVDPLSLAINLVNDFQPQAGESDKKFDINEYSFQEAFGGKSLLVVKNLIAQALSNLLENAVKYADQRTAIKVEGTRIQLSADGPLFAGIAVESIGLPISSEEVKKIMDRGVRGTAAKQRIPAGTGIGLYIANRIMAIHEGLVLAKVRGKVSIFALIFPDSRVK